MKEWQKLIKTKIIMSSKKSLGGWIDGWEGGSKSWLKNQQQSTNLISIKIQLPHFKFTWTENGKWFDVAKDTIGCIICAENSFVQGILPLLKAINLGKDVDWLDIRLPLFSCCRPSAKLPDAEMLPDLLLSRLSRARVFWNQT